MPHFPSYYHTKQSYQVEQIRREVSTQMQSLQQTILEELRKVLKGIEREHNHTNEVYTQVVQIKDEMEQVHKQVDMLVVHLLLPDLPLQKMSEAIREVTDYHTKLQDKQCSLDTIRNNFIVGMTNAILPLTSLISPIGPTTDKMQVFRAEEEEEDNLPEPI